MSSDEDLDVMVDQWIAELDTDEHHDLDLGLTADEKKMMGETMASKPLPAKRQQISKDARNAAAAAKKLGKATKAPKAASPKRSPAPKASTTTKTPSPMKKAAKPSPAKPLLMNKKNVYSRAYHGAKDTGLKQGMSEDDAKQFAREQAQKAVDAM